MVGAHAHRRRHRDRPVDRLAIIGQRHGRAVLIEHHLDAGVHPVDQRRGGRALVAAEAGRALPPPDLIELLAAHHDRGAVLARHRDDLRGRVGVLHVGAERRYLEAHVGCDIVAGGRARHASILGAIDGLVRPRHGLVDPLVGDDAGMAGAIAGEDRRVAGAGLCRGVALIALGEDRALLQPREAAGEARAIFGEHVGGELVHGDDHEQLGRGRGRLRGKRRAGEEQGAGKQTSEAAHHRNYSPWVVSGRRGIRRVWEAVSTCF